MSMTQSVESQSLRQQGDGNGMASETPGSVSELQAAPGSRDANLGCRPKGRKPPHWTLWETRGSPELLWERSGPREGVVTHGSLKLAVFQENPSCSSRMYPMSRGERSEKCRRGAHAGCTLLLLVTSKNRHRAMCLALQGLTRAHRGGNNPERCKSPLPLWSVLTPRAAAPRMALSIHSLCRL